MAIQIGEHDEVFIAIDRAYGLIDGSSAWPDCLEALTHLADVEVSRLLLYDCGRGHSQVIEAAGIDAAKERSLRKVDIDEELWQSAPGEVWLPTNDAQPRRTDLALLGYSVLDRDSANILYLEFLQKADRAREAADGVRLLQTLLPHLHRACRLHRAITGDDLLAFASPDLAQQPSSTGLPIELRLRRRFRLSKAEARVATLLADGLAPRMIAERLNVSIHTVRSQLQAIFNKTDTSRQAELTSLILKETEVPRSICRTGAADVTRSEQPPCP